MRKSFTRAILVAALGMIFAGCQDLDLPYYNRPDRTRVIATPEDVEVLIYSTYRRWWESAHHSQPNRALSVMGNEMTTALTGASGTYDVAREPRETIPNTLVYPGYWMMRRPWDLRWEVISSAVDGIQAIEQRGIRIFETVDTDRVDVTERARAFAYFTAGLGHIYLAFHFDQSYIYTPDMELREDIDFKHMADYGFGFHPYNEVAEAGRELLRKALEISEEHPFAIPARWVNQDTDVSAEDFRRIIHSFIARSLAYTPRSPEERAAVDWSDNEGGVLYHVERGIQKDLYVKFVEGTWESPYQQFVTFINDARLANRLLGPADTSGAYQDWLAAPINDRTRFQIRTPDRRITGASATTRGEYVNYSSRAAGVSNSQTRGQYLDSHYYSVRHMHQDSLRIPGTKLVTMTPLEMEFLKAEAYYRIGQKDKTVEIVNKTRTRDRIVPVGSTTVAYPGLPPVTIDGVPEAGSCVPKKPWRNPDGSIPCGDLWDALMYEKRIELHGIEAIIPYADARGWGQLVEGTMIHFPVTARELEIIGYPEYSFGGAGRPGGAPPPTTVSP